MCVPIFRRRRIGSSDNVLTAVDRKGQGVTYTYDALNRIATAAYADGATVGYIWDGANRLTQLVDSVGGTITRAWDGLDRLTSETTAKGTVGYTYDTASRRTKMTVTGQTDVTYGYDNANRSTSVIQGAAHVTFGYDNANRRTAVNLANGIAGAYAYDAASQLSGVTWRKGSTTVGTLTYTYDKAGRVSGRGGTLFQSVFPAAVTSATFDADNRLTAWTTASGTIHPAYDANGNLANDGVRAFTWDARNRLTAIAATPASFVYDGAGRRTTATIAGIATGYLYDGADIVQELAGATPNAGLLTGLSIDERFSRTTGGATSTFLTDFLGSTVALTDSTGAIKTSYAYDPYGVTTTTGAANTSSYQFTGRENDGATGLYYYRARYYNPAWGRFISEDPIGLRGGVNLYAYAGGDPLDLRDPLGLDPDPTCNHFNRSDETDCRLGLKKVSDQTLAVLGGTAGAGVAVGACVVGCSAGIQFLRSETAFRSLNFVTGYVDDPNIPITPADAPGVPRPIIGPVPAGAPPGPGSPPPPLVLPPISPPVF